MKSNRRGQTTSRDDHRLWFIRQGGSHLRRVCEECEERSQMLTLGEAGVAANVEPQTIYTLMEARKLHFLVTPEAVLLVCLNSLIKFGADAERPCEP